MSQENGHHHHDYAPRAAGLPPLAYRTGLRTQIDMGRYHIWQNEQLVGQVFVEQLAGGLIVEHWWLGPAYSAPSATSSTTHDVSLRFKYDAAEGGAAAILKEFNQHGGQYVRAECAVVTRSP